MLVPSLPLSKKGLPLAPLTPRRRGLRTPEGYQIRARCPVCIAAKTIIPAFEKRKSSHCEVNWQGDRWQGSTLSPRSRVQARFKGFQHRLFLGHRPFPSERIPVFRFQLGPSLFILRGKGEQLSVHKCSSLVMYPRFKLWFQVLLETG